MKIELKGRKAIVMGSTAGIGRATAEGLARRRFGRPQWPQARPGRRSGAEDVPSFPESEISGVVADPSTAEGAHAIFAQAPDSDIDILVNNVGTAFIRDYAGRDRPRSPR